MGFSLSQRRKVGSQVRKIAAEQIEAALDDIEASQDFDNTVHELRRRCKRIRGLLRLVRPNFSGFDIENAAFRDAADALSAVRDAVVMLETFDTVLAEDLAGSVPAETRNALRAAIEDNVRCLARQQDRSGVLDGFSHNMAAARERVAHWTFSAGGFALIEPGLHDTYARMRKRFKAAKATGDDDAFHDWCKDTKSHWFHVSLLKDSAPDRLGARKAQLDTLGEYLGDHHNLAVLAAGLTALSGPLDPALGRLIATRRTALAGQAFALGRQLVVERPVVLVSRIKKFWNFLPKDD